MRQYGQFCSREFYKSKINENSLKYSAKKLFVPTLICIKAVTVVNIRYIQTTLTDHLGFTLNRPQFW